MSADIPADRRYLLEQPFYGVLGTVRPDDTAQVSPMWFELIDGQLRFTHTTKRAKFRNLQRNPSMSLAVFDPETPARYLEVRGKLVEVIDDPEGAFYVRLGHRYGNPTQQPPPDSPDRVILVMSIDHVVTQVRPPKGT
jgi:PPOX class probable F420-dependent enzyme